MDAAVDPSPEPSVGSAATVVLLREGESGPEVLLGERPHDRGSFAGAWVFPGGAVDDEDAGSDPIGSSAAARRAAVRETREEVGLEVAPDELVEFAVWSPPRGVPKRMRTRFFAGRAPEGEARPAPDELIELAWLAPGEALERHAVGAMRLFPPTWVTLHELRGLRTVDEALQELGAEEPRAYVGRFAADRSALYWQEDAQFAADESARPSDDLGRPGPAGPLHRLVMDRLPWEYVRSF
ncbi:NUDIX hydrolase [Agromyces sp. SYSU T0242]|uniref:NUDIX hydrolase n=1 Tax=Agromyces litoreus TaxID=3158561 RepID=UPI00339AC6AC